MVTVSVAFGTAAGFQLPGVNQSEDTAPVHTGFPAAAGCARPATAATDKVSAMAGLQDQPVLDVGAGSGLWRVRPYVIFINHSQALRPEQPHGRTWPGALLVVLALAAQHRLLRHCEALSSQRCGSGATIAGKHHPPRNRFEGAAAIMRPRVKVMFSGGGYAGHRSVSARTNLHRWVSGGKAPPDVARGLRTGHRHRGHRAHWRQTVPR